MSVRQSCALLACIFGVVVLFLANTITPIRESKRVRARYPITDGQLVEAPHNAWHPPHGRTQFPIWPSDPPDMDGVRQPPESVGPSKGHVAGRSWSAVHNVTSPTLTIFSPKGRNTGAAMVVFPGGGFKVLAIDLEGTEICDWMTSIGITCILLKYRVPKSNHYYDDDCKCLVTPKVLRALQDAQRAIRIVRAQARTLNIDPSKVGVIGMSAGGYLVAQTSNSSEPTYRPVDAIDRLSSRPDFSIALYPGHLCRAGFKLDPALRVTEQTSPTFLLHARDDQVNSVCNSTVYARSLKKAGVPTAVHLFARGGHAFGLRRTTDPITGWPTMVETWLEEIGIL